MVSVRLVFMFDIGSIPMTSHYLHAKDDVIVLQTVHLWHFEAKLYTKMNFIMICGIIIAITVV